MDLNFWSEKYWRPGRFQRLLLSLGAHRYRCEYCRVNFVSFRPRREKFTFRRWERLRSTVRPGK